MKTLYESILDTDSQTQKKIKKHSKAVKRINDFVDLIKKDFGKYVDKKDIDWSFCTFEFKMDKSGLDKFIKLYCSKIPGFDIDINGPTDIWFILKDEDVWFVWRYFNFNEKKGWDLTVSSLLTTETGKQTDLQKYAEDLLKEKLLK